jgi:hypothetical protein
MRCEQTGKTLSEVFSPVPEVKNRSRAKSLKKMERVKGIEPSYSAWKSPDFPNVFNAHSDILQLFGRLRSLQNFPLSEWSCEPHERSPSLWKSVKYGRQRLYQQNGASAQHARPHHEQGQDTFPKLLVAGDVIRVWHLFAPAFSVRRRCHRPSRGIAERRNLPEN